MRSFVAAGGHFPVLPPGRYEAVEFAAMATQSKYPRPRGVLKAIAGSQWRKIKGCRWTDPGCAEDQEELMGDDRRFDGTGRTQPGLGANAIVGCQSWPGSKEPAADARALPLTTRLCRTSAFHADRSPGYEMNNHQWRWKCRQIQLNFSGIHGCGQWAPEVSRSRPLGIGNIP